MSNSRGNSLAAPRLRSPRARGLPAMRIAGGLLCIAVALLGALWILPGVLDWSSFRGAIATYAGHALGRPVAIDGPIDVVLLPAPVVVARGVRLGDRGDGIAVTAPALRLRLAAAPLLLGRAIPRALVLSHPNIHLPWPLPPADLAGSSPAWLSGSSARIEHATVAIGALVLSDVTAELGPDLAVELGAAQDAPPTGLLIAGTARALGQAWRFSDRLGTPDGHGDVPAEATLDADLPPANPAAGHPAPTLAAPHARFIGTLAHDGALTGRLQAGTPDLSRLMPAPPVAAQADGTIALGHAQARAQLALVVGGVPITATLRPARAGRASGAQAGAQVLSLSAGQLNLDAWDAALARLRAGRMGPGSLALPFPVLLDVSADAVQLGGGLIRGLHAALDLVGDHGVLRDAGATLPGGATATLHGTLRDATDGLTLTGEATLDAPRLRDTLDWLRATGLRIGPGLPADVLRQATLAGHIVARRDRVEVSHLAGTIEGATIAGSVAVDSTSGALTADLATDRLDADRWFTPGGSLGWPALSARLAGFDLQLKLRAHSLVLRGQTIDGATLDLGTSAGGLAVNALAGTLAGLPIHATGTIDASGAISDARLDIDAPHATGLGPLLAGLLPADAPRPADYLWAGPIRLHLEAAGPQNAVVATATLDFSDARLDAHPLLDLTAGTWSALLTLRHPGAPRLLAALGLAQAHDWIGEGSLSLLAQIAGGRGAIAIPSFDLTAATLHAGGDLTWNGITRTLAGHIAADTLPLPPIAWHAATPLPWNSLANITADLAVTARTVTIGDADVLANATTHLRLAGGIATADPIAATIGGGTLAGTVRLDAGATPPSLAITAQITHATLPDGLAGTSLDLSGFTTDATLALTAHGYSPQALLAGLAGTLSLSGQGGRILGIDAAAAQGQTGTPLATALSSGATPADTLNLAATIANGLAQLTRADITTPLGPIHATGTLDLPANQLDLGTTLPGNITLRLTGPAGSPARRVVEGR